jgi:hypothetical protein
MRCRDLPGILDQRARLDLNVLSFGEQFMQSVSMTMNVSNEIVSVINWLFLSSVRGSKPLRLLTRCLPMQKPAFAEIQDVPYFVVAPDTRVWPLAETLYLFNNLNAYRAS